MSLDMQSNEPRSPVASSNGAELSRLMNAALVSVEFCNLLLNDPASALTEGYNGESFRLAASDQELVLSIKASSLNDFALQLAKNRKRTGSSSVGSHSGLHHRHLVAS